MSGDYALLRAKYLTLYARRLVWNAVINTVDNGKLDQTWVQTMGLLDARMLVNLLDFHSLRFLTFLCIANRCTPKVCRISIIGCHCANHRWISNASNESDH